MEIVRTLRRAPAPPALSHRDRETAELLAGAQPSAVTFFRINEPVFVEGDPAGPLYFVEFGAVRVFRMTADGRRQISAFHFAGEIFGFEAGSEHKWSAESIDGVGVRVLRPGAGRGFEASLLALALRSLERSQLHLMLLGRMSALARMAAFLADLTERRAPDGIIDLPMQRGDIADYLGLTFETVSRVLRVLKTRGIIRVPRIDRIEILDPAALAEIAD